MKHQKIANLLNEEANDFNLRQENGRLSVIVQMQIIV